MIYIGNIEILTAKSAIYLGNVGSSHEILESISEVLSGSRNVVDLMAMLKYRATGTDRSAEELTEVAERIASRSQQLRDQMRQLAGAVAAA